VIPPARFAVTTVLAARGYPDAPEKGAAIVIPEMPADVVVFHAGTRVDDAGVLRVGGGRVLSVTAVASTFEAARARSGAGAAAVDFAGKIFRTDIGWREAARR
jgi:phosphoribosylamine--glycine ligase